MNCLYRYMLLITCAASIISCNKSKFLDASPNEAIVVPKTLIQLQAVLDNDEFMNGNGQAGVNPAFGEVASDNYFVLQDALTVMPTDFQNLYVWKDNIYTSTMFCDWSFPYRTIQYSNIVLDGLKKINKDEKNSDAFDNILGSSLFYRSEMLYQLAQVFVPPYNKTTSSQNYGVVLKKTSDIYEPIKRSTIQDAYDNIIDDLKKAIVLLPVHSKYKTRPSKPAALALLARVYLSMQEYELAYLYSDSCLKIYSELLDYNFDINIVDNYSIARYNKEVIFHSRLIQTAVSDYLLFSVYNSRVDTNLVRQYDVNDLRYKAFYQEADGGMVFKGSYDGSGTLFGGIATDEIFLIRAETAARLGRTQDAMDDLNTLLKTRWDNSIVYPELTASSPEEALVIVLRERRKELVFRGLRWTDLRRLNQEGANITVKRILDGKEYTLLPNDKRYTFLIPPDVIGFNPGMPQNPR